MPAIRWTKPARDDLRSIDAWLTAHAPPQVAVDMLISIRSRGIFLESFPHGGRPIGEGVRMLRVIGTPYLILYRIAREEVQVLRIRHEREDWFVEP